MSNIYAVGETTYDIVFKNNQPSHAIVGGSALNTAVSLGRIGLPIHFISRLGNDKIGDLSIRFLIDNGVKTENIIRFKGNSRISLAFLDNENNAEYQFYQIQQPSSLEFPEPTGDDILLFGSSNAIQDEGRNNLLSFLKQAFGKRVLTIYDPNIRETDKNKLTGNRQKVEENMQFTQILKGSEQDFYRLYNTSDAEIIFSKVKLFGIKALIVTAGEYPVRLITGQIAKTYPLESVKTISTIGAGDNFTAGMIAGFYKHHVSIENLNSVTENCWDEIISFGNSFANEVCRSDDNYISTRFASRFSKEYLKS
jgi:fructokinase